MKIEKRGRQFTKRTVSIHETEFGPMCFEAVRLPRVSFARLDGIKAEALSVLRESGIDPAPTLSDSPHGSGLKDMVINGLSKEPDSIEGLASRIYEIACHAQAYKDMGAHDQVINLMGRLGELVSLFDIYRSITAQKSDAGKKGGAQNKTDADDRIIELAQTLKRTMEPRSIAGAIAQRTGFTTQHVRRVLKNANQSSD